MEICNDDHDVVCYETAKCPACLAHEDGYAKGHEDGYAKGCVDNDEED